MDNIKIKVKLSAYTKGALPDISNLIPDTPDDNKIYARKNNTWVDINDELDKTDLITDLASGVELELVGPSTYRIAQKKWEGYIDELPEELEEGTIYYAIENKNQKADVIVQSGTAYSEENTEIRQTLVGGNASTTDFDYVMLPMNARGEYNGN